METLASLPIEELLQRCCATPGADVWQEFIRRFHRLIALVALRTAGRLGDASPQTVDDLIQETYLKLCADQCRILRNFQHNYPEAFLGYLKVVTANVVRDHFKALHSGKRGSQYIDSMDDEFVAAAGEESAGSPRAMERAILIKELTRHLDLCTAGPDQARNNRVFWLYYRVGLSAKAIADLPGIGLSCKGIESVLSRITRELRERMTDPVLPPKRGPQLMKGILPAASLLDRRGQMGARRE
jgi:RNA polymerase sigma-70 factor (ECF subfamily)